VLTVVQDGVVRPGAIDVVLVGHHPPPEWLASQSPRYVGLQARLDRPDAQLARLPQVVSLLSFDYARAFSWRGREAMPRDFEGRLARIVRARSVFPGRRLRAYEVPLRADVVRALLASGVDLIGVKRLRANGEAFRRAVRPQVPAEGEPACRRR
jgi:hypothetical protein